MEYSDPVPQPDGSLQPPRRTPPTAVGVMTPPPPPRRVPSRRYGHSRLVNRFTMACCATSLAGAGFTTLSLGSGVTAIVLGSTTLAAGGAILVLLLRSWWRYRTHGTWTEFHLVRRSSGSSVKSGR